LGATLIGAREGAAVIPLRGRARRKASELATLKARDRGAKKGKSNGQRR